MTFELPIFPLGVVLFPGMPLPLHIFEPRYRLMMARCLEDDRTFGVAQISEGTEGQSGTVPCRVGCSAQILEVAPFADGRMNLQTLGMQRFEILELREHDEYLIGTCQWLEDEPMGDGIVRHAMSLRRALSRYFDALAKNTELPAQLGEIDVPQDPFALSMFVAAILSLPNTQKQTLLEMTSTQARIEVEEFLLERGEIVQRAFTQRNLQGRVLPTDEKMEGYADFVFLN